MDSIIEKYIKFSQTIASLNEDTPFLKIFFPIILVLGCSVFFYFGYKGIVKKKTISLFKMRGFSARESQELFGGGITGNMAMFFGILYLLMGILLLIVLGGSSYYTVFG